MSTAQSAAAVTHGLHEGSWVYLSLGDPDRQSRLDLRQRVIEACESSGWPAVSWSTAPNRGHDPERHAEGMSHAVEHADVVVVLMDSDSVVTDAELAFAYKHRRPVIGLSLASVVPQSSPVRAMLATYERARMVDCADIAECATSLREALSDPGFIGAIHEETEEALERV